MEATAAARGMSRHFAGRNAIFVSVRIVARCTALLEQNGAILDVPCQPLQWRHVSRDGLCLGYIVEAKKVTFAGARWIWSYNLVFDSLVLARKTVR
jgi:hypothetical protein